MRTIENRLGEVGGCVGKVKAGEEVSGEGEEHVTGTGVTRTGQTKEGGKV